MKLEKSIQLSKLTTICLGGRAEYFVSAQNIKEIEEAIQFSQEQNLKLIVLGGGSNVIFPDENLKALILKIDLKGVKFINKDNKVVAKVAAGENWDNFVLQAIEKGLSGVESLSGIPGSVGATPMQNVGAYGQEVANTITKVCAINKTTLKQVEFSKKECDFSYRSSRFKTYDKDKYIITKVEFVLDKINQPKIYYPELTRAIEKENVKDSGSRMEILQKIRQKVLELRKNKSMVIDKNDPNSKSCGSFFTNPIVSNQIFEKIKKDYPQIPSFPENKKIKIPAAWLIEQSGFKKGHKHKGVGISTNHSLAIINTGSGKADEVKDLAAKIQKAVKNKFGLILTPEPVIIEF